jgi:hypothetical protein
VRPVRPRALVRYLATRAGVAAGDPLFCGRWRPGLSARGIQLAIARLGRRAAVGTRCSPHTFRHTFARGYLVNGGDVFSLQQILGHATLDMVRRYVYFASFETVRRLHAAASPADELLIGPKVPVHSSRVGQCARGPRGGFTRDGAGRHPRGDRAAGGTRGATEPELTVA